MPNPMLSVLDALPPDPLLGLMAAFRADERANKTDLGVGVYKDENGETPVMAAVREAERRLVEGQTTKVYQGPRGDADFCAAVERLVYGGDPDADRVTSFATPGGCGALSLGMRLANAARRGVPVWMSDPCWPNHPHVARALGMTPRDYAYLDRATGRADFQAVSDDLKDVMSGDVVLIQGPCHNPSGSDLTTEEWGALAEICLARGALPLIDIAYHGLGDGLDADMEGVRAFLAAVPEAIVSYSCSKNFGLYRERTGCLLIQAETAAAREAAATHAASIARADWSMPPAHGQAAVATILADEALTKQWSDELASMRARILDLRTAFGDALAAEGRETAGAAVTAQKGMFSMLPIDAAGAERLRAEHAIYMPGSGRINVAGLVSERIAETAKAIAGVITA